MIFCWSEFYAKCIDERGYNQMLFLSANTQHPVKMYIKFLINWYKYSKISFLEHMVEDLTRQNEDYFYNTLHHLFIFWFDQRYSVSQSKFILEKNTWLFLREFIRCRFSATILRETSFVDSGFLPKYLQNRVFATRYAVPQIA